MFVPLRLQRHGQPAAAAAAAGASHIERPCPARNPLPRTSAPFAAMTSASMSPPTPWLMAEGAVASCMAAVFSTPFETVKVRLQLQGELQRRTEYEVQYRSTLHAMKTIAKNEGPLALQKGLGASCVHQTILNGLRLGLYAPVGEISQSMVGGPGFVANFISGFVCGAIGAFAGSPVFLAKTRLQSQSNVIAVGMQHEYRGLADALRCVHRRGGVRGLFHGVENAVVRTSCGSAVQLSTYDLVKKMVGTRLELEATDVRVHLAASLMGGVCVAVTMSPLDTIMTRTYNNDAHQYNQNIFSSLAKVVKAEGVGGLYKGSFALWTRIGPHTMCTFIFLEQIKQIRPSFQRSVESIVD